MLKRGSSPKRQRSSLSVSILSDMVELICELEEKCEIDFGEPEGLETIGDLIAYVASLQE